MNRSWFGRSGRIRCRPTMLIGRPESRGRVHGGDHSGNGLAYRPAHYFPALQSRFARRSDSRRSDRLDRRARLDRHRRLLHAGHSQRNHARDRPGEQRHAVSRRGPGRDRVAGAMRQRRHAGGRGQRAVQPGGRASGGRDSASAYRGLAQRDGDGGGGRGRSGRAGGLGRRQSWRTSCNRWRTRCGSRSIAGSRHLEEGATS